MQHQTSAQTAWFVCDLQHFMISAATAMASVLHTVSHYQCSKCYGKHVAYTISLQTQQLLWQACCIQHLITNAAIAMANVLHTASHYKRSNCYGKPCGMQHLPGCVWLAALPSSPVPHLP
jgi:hypothetical protein